MMASIASSPSLMPDERRILQVLSVVYEPVNQTTLQAVLGLLNWRGQEGRPLSALLAKPLRERLLDQGLLVKEGLVCASSLVESFTRETVREGTFGQIAAAAESIVSCKLRQSWETVTARRQVRRLRNALYRGNAHDVLTLLGLAERGPEQPVT
jgi:hypothetical protein